MLLVLRQVKVIERTFGEAANNYFELCAIAISFIGLGVRCLIAGYVPRGTSGRNTKSQVAESLNTKGVYSVVRNPLYVGNFIIVFGITLFIQSLWLAITVWVGFWVYYLLIIFAEEEFLRRKFKDQFISWAKKTPRVIPRLGSWEKPDLPFSFKTMLRREFSTFFAIVASLFFLKVSNNILTNKKVLFPIPWLAFFLAGFCIYWLFFILKKKTKILNIPGR